MKPPRAVFFDLDDTLVHLEGGIGPSILGTCEILAGRMGVDATRLQAANVEAWAPYWREVEMDWVLGRIADDSVGLEGWRRTLRACGCDDEELVLLARRTHLQMSDNSLRLFEDVLPLFERLAHSHSLALITNGASDMQRRKLKATGIESYFSSIVVSGEKGAAKPDAIAFGHALSELAVSPGNAWHVGDNLRTDVGGAQGAGLTAVWLNRQARVRSAFDPVPDLEVYTLDGLIDLVGGGGPIPPPGSERRRSRRAGEC